MECESSAPLSVLARTRSKAVLKHRTPKDVVNSRAVVLRTLEHDRIAGGRVYDAHIAEIARLSGAKAVVTDNRRHFTSLARHGIRIWSAEEFVAEAT